MLPSICEIKPDQIEGHVAKAVVKQLRDEDVRVDQIERFSKVDEEEHCDQSLISYCVEIRDQLMKSCFAAMPRTKAMLTGGDDAVLVQVVDNLLGEDLLFFEM